MGTPLENFFRDARTGPRHRAPSGDIVIVAIDDKSIAEMKGWPWPRRHHARLVDELNRLGSKEIYFDLDFSSPSTPEDDAALQAAIVGSKAKVTLPAFYVIDRATNTRSEIVPLPIFARSADLANINARFDFLGQVRTLPYRETVAGKKLSSFAAKIAAVDADRADDFPLDFSIDPRQFPTVSASDVLSRRVGRSNIANKTILIGFTSPQINDVYSAPGYGMISGVLFQAVGAETLKMGEPVVLGWWPALLLGIGILLTASRQKRLEHRAMLVSGSAATLITFQFLLEINGIFADLIPALLTLFVLGVRSGSGYLKQVYTRRGRTNSLSGLPTLQVLVDEIQEEKSLVVAKVHNFSEIASAFGSNEQLKLVSKLSDRLSLVTQGREVHQGDEGVFAWLSDEEPEALKIQLDSLYEIFRLPLTIDKRAIDISLTFGLDTQTLASPSVRIGGALVAADKALKVGDKWQVYDPTEATETAWRLSLMGQLGQALSQGDIWVAFQPKLDLATNRVVGAEALARWSHPDEGEIAPADFVLAAEQNGRIDELTCYVLERAISACASMSGRNLEFGVAVNISASLVGSSELFTTIQRLLQEKHLPPHLLTLEITETAVLAVANESSSRALKKLQRLGVQLSIDDYGTGLSTMEYLKLIPASELKIDRSFIKSIETSRTDRLMVRSTIDLAHSLGQKVVAEGVERSRTLSLLKEMNCDLAQGYLVGKPVPLEQLEHLLKEQARAA